MRGRNSFHSASAGELGLVEEDGLAPRTLHGLVASSPVWRLRWRWHLLWPRLLRGRGGVVVAWIAAAESVVEGAAQRPHHLIELIGRLQHILVDLLGALEASVRRMH